MNVHSFATGLSHPSNGTSPTKISCLKMLADAKGRMMAAGCRDEIKVYGFTIVGYIDDWHPPFLFIVKAHT